ncbi:hypothetical protein [Bacillus toyonensis]|uniref:Group-specific protein n=1 Tax=Bacillus toyonensis TaxID=155322 RepID=A0A2B5X250_9BACI|nr:hypothetical protein [Bacillus toyonensis]PGA90435.1 hypothetical protein COL93_28310 [Bacillus toyonensis]PHD56882.1 hypothetical protein COF40_29460 [Bacillus toyonensis]
MDKSCFRDSTQLLQEIDRKMSIIESILQQISGYLVTEDIYEIHYMLVEVSQLLLTLQHGPKMKPLAKTLSLQLKNIQEQYNRLFCREDIRRLSSEQSDNRR